MALFHAQSTRGQRNIAIVPRNTWSESRELIFVELIFVIGQFAIRLTGLDQGHNWCIIGRSR